VRKISKAFMDDLQNQMGILRPILEKVQKDHTLLFAIRENTVVDPKTGQLAKSKLD
jgi:hypothetical protein